MSDGRWFLSQAAGAGWRSGRRRGLGEVGVEVAPGGVGLFDQAKLPGATPAFEALLAQDGAFHAGMYFVPDETVDAVFPGEARNQVGLVLPHAPRQVRGHADVKGAVALAGEDVDAGNLGVGWGHAEMVDGGSEDCGARGQR